MRRRSARRKNVAPRLRQYVTAVLKKAAQFCGLRGTQLLHTYGHAPRAGGVYAVSMAINDFTVRRSSDDRFHGGIGRQGGERWTREIDNELLLVGCQCG